MNVKMNYFRNDEYKVIKIVSCDDGCRISINRDGFKKITDNISNMPIVVISLAGKYRIGKSFLANSLIPVLEYYERNGSLTGFSNMNLDFHMHGFKYESGSSSVTKGIDMLNKPFIIPNPNNSFEKIAILLMDSQGLDAIDAGGGVDEILFSLTSLISSHVIFNVSGNIEPNRILNLISLASHSKNHSKNVFSSLDILIRDYKFKKSDISDMRKECKNFVDEMSGINGSILRNNLNQLKDYFRFVKCYPLPNPGSYIETKKYDGDISKIRSTFVDILHDYVFMLFDKEHLKPKFKEAIQLLDLFERMSENIEIEGRINIDSFYEMMLESSDKDIIRNFISQFVNPASNSCYDMNKYQLSEKIKEIKREFEKVKCLIYNKTRLNDFYIDYVITNMESQYRIKEEKEKIEEERKKQRDIEHELVLLQKTILARKFDKMKQQKETITLLKSLVEEQRRTIEIQQDLIIQQNNRK